MRIRKKKMKRYGVYIEVDDFAPIEYGRRHFKIAAWLLAKFIKHIYGGVCNDIITYVYDRKKGVITYEK